MCIQIYIPAARYKGVWMCGKVLSIRVESHLHVLFDQLGLSNLELCEVHLQKEQACRQAGRQAGRQADRHPDRQAGKGDEARGHQAKAIANANTRSLGFRV